MLDKMKEIICNYVEIAPEEITESSRLIEDIGLNSYDFMCMLGDLETEFGITVDENEIVNLQTVGEVIAYLETLKD